ncbi:uncharacterized protein LOC104863570 [Fukomys damarensis]|uniref:uncharacterized protein LOC104863570 n=1 Tax=Fukomys damarensis TaxID=885580 RepID=UPI00054024E2|nr:uncharacterized protein LOC104863570 [Fukomys damarensis]
MKFSRGKLQTLCNLEWPTFGVGWPAEGPFEPRLCRAVWAKVIEHPGHPDQFPYINVWAQACEEPPAWLQHCSLRTGSRILVMVPNGIKSAKRQAPRPMFSQEPDPLEPTDPGGAARKPTNLSKVSEVLQGPEEYPSAFLECLLEADRTYTPIDPDAPANRQDLWEVNSQVETIHLTVPNPYTLLSLIPPAQVWYSVLDLKDAFFSLPLAPVSQLLFAFEWTDPDTGTTGQLTWTRLPQGFKNSPTLFGEALSKDLQEPPRDSWRPYKVWDIECPGRKPSSAKPRFDSKILEPRWKGPFPVVLSTPLAVKVAGHLTWIHRNHFKPGPDNRGARKMECCQQTQRIESKTPLNWTFVMIWVISLGTIIALSRQNLGHTKMFGCN